MKIKQKERKSIFNGERQQFAVKQSSEMFRVLMDGLYSNKIDSIVREIWSNAFDAHKMAEKEDVPFDVTIPTHLNPFFRVRDYGVGMSHEKVMSTYSTFFDSTKGDTNDAVGMFGLGSKSPFAYTDSFFVYTYHRNVKRSYFASVDETGIPSFSFVGETPSIEKRGVEINIPVESEDFDDFRKYMNQNAEWYDVKPNIVNPGQKIEWPRTSDVILKGEGWRLHEPENSWESEKVYARMGCVAYPVPYNLVSNVMGYNLFKGKMIIDFEIGELAVTASRESLSFHKDEPTELNIVNRLKFIKNDLRKAFLRELDGAECMFDARILAVKIRGTVGQSTSPAYNRIKYRGMPIYTTGSHINYEGLALRHIHLDGNGKRLPKQFHGLGDITKRNTALIIKPADYKVTRFFDKIKNYEFDDINDVYIVEYSNNRDSINSLISFMEQYDGITTISVEDINAVKLETEPRQKRSKFGWYARSDFAVIKNGRTHSVGENGHVSYPVDGGYYYLAAGGRCQWTKDRLIRKVKNFLEAVGLENEVVMLATNSVAIKNVEAKTNWVPVEELYKKVINDCKQQVIDSMIAVRTKDMYKRIDLVKDYHDIPQDVIKYKDQGVVNGAELLYNMATYYKMEEVTAAVKTGIERVNAALREINDAFPLLRYLGEKAPEEEVMNYIKLIGETK